MTPIKIVAFDSNILLYAVWHVADWLYWWSAVYHITLQNPILIPPFPSVNHIDSFCRIKFHAFLNELISGRGMNHAQ